MYQTIFRDPGGPSLVRVLTNQNVVDGSLLIVGADTEAFFVINGLVSNPYGPGRYEIYTGENPFFVHFRHIMTNGDPGITCQVFFVNKKKMNIEQGGTGNMVFLEKRYKISMSAKAAYTICYFISNPKAFLSKLVGMHNYSFDSEDIKLFIDSKIIPVIKESVVAGIAAGTVHSIQSRLMEISNVVRDRLGNALLDYGITLSSISITAINIDENELRRLNEFEEREARGRLNTDIEVDNIERVYGNVNNRTMAEVATGSVRGPANPFVGRNGVNNMAGAIATLPWQVEMAKLAMNQLSGNNTTATAGGTNGMAVNQSEPPSNADRRVPPPIPRKRRACPECKNIIDDSDVYCKYCGHKL